MIAEHDRVMLARDIPQLGLRAGDVGTVVYVHAGAVAYEVEFCATGGSTIGIETLEPHEVSVLDLERVWNARPLAEAGSA